MVISKDYKEFLELLNENNVQYLIVGGYALAAHGHPRYTKDMDVWINMTKPNSSAVMKALIDFGFGEIGLTTADFEKPDTIIQLGYPPNRIDLMTEVTGVTFEDCYSRRYVFNIEDIKVNFIDIESLIQNKKATGRLQDLADLEKLEE